MHATPTSLPLLLAPKDLQETSRPVPARRGRAENSHRPPPARSEARFPRGRRRRKAAPTGTPRLGGMPCSSPDGFWHAPCLTIRLLESALGGATRVRRLGVQPPEPSCDPQTGFRPMVQAKVPFRSRYTPPPPTGWGAWERRHSPLGPYPGANRRKGGGRLVLASNRLPVTLTPKPDGRWRSSPASGGLVSALWPILSRRGGVWTGWTGAPGAGQAELDGALENLPGGDRCRLQAVALTEEEVESYYGGFSNQVLWPLFHGFSHLCRPAPHFWESYRRVNARFADSLAACLRWDDLIWVQDYHLMLLGKELRERGLEHRMVYFLHIPFPPLELLERIPGHRELVEGLLHFDLVGFQTVRDREHFLDAARQLFPESFPPESGIPDPVLDGRQVLTGTFPISIDFQGYSGDAHGSVVLALEQAIRNQAGGRTLLLGVDRLDYTKGIPEKLKGLDLALERWPELRGSVVLKQLVVPSRDTVPAYRDAKAEIEERVDALNRRWGTADWVPVEYRYESWTRAELLAHYRAADAALVTPLNDGMNLVAKEYVAANAGSGVLILSVFAGTAGELGESALLVNPSESESVAVAIRQAHVMAPEERRERMDRARNQIRSHDVHRWVKHFLEAGIRVR